MSSLSTNKERLSTSKEICARESEVLAKTQKLPYCPIAFKSGKGALLYDYEGKEYIDLLASASSANIGHGNEEVADAVREQMAKLAQFSIGYRRSGDLWKVLGSACHAGDPHHLGGEPADDFGHHIVFKGAGAGGHL